MNLSRYGCSPSQSCKGRLLAGLSEWAVLTGEEGVLILQLGTWNSVLVEDNNLAKEGIFRYKSQGIIICSIRNWEW